MTLITKYVEVEVDIDSYEVLEDINDEDLQEELEKRGLLGASGDISIRMTDIYYALRDRDLDKVIELINPVLDDTIGRCV